MKTNEIIFSVLDLVKAASSDDQYITEELVLFLCKKYRAFLIKKEQEKEKATTDIASEFEYQEICLDLEKVAAEGNPCGGFYLRTIQAIPKILEGTTPRIYPTDFYQGTNITLVPKDKMRYVGTNKYLQNVIYGSIGTDFHLYLNSGNPQFAYLTKLRMSAIFEDPEEAAKLACSTDSESSNTCDPFEMEFPIRDYLVPMLIELVAKQITGAIYKPADTTNNAADDLADLAAWARRNMKSPLQKQIEG